MTKLRLDNMSDKDYHASPEISVSQLKQFLDSPAKWEYYKNNRPDTKAMMIGRAFHDAILLPTHFQNTYAVECKIDKRTKEGKEQALAFEKENANKTILSDNDFRTITEMRERLLKIPFVCDILKSGKPETSWFYDDQTGIKRKSRLDLITDDCIYDFKTTASVKQHDFSRQIYNMRWHMQAASYIDAVAGFDSNVRPFVFIAIEKEPPYDVGIYMLDDESVESGRSMYRFALDHMEIYLKAKEQNPFLNDIVEMNLISIPTWSK